MGFLDYIRHRRHPEVKKTFSDLYFNYRKGLEHFAYKSKALSRSYGFLFYPKDMPYRDMKIIADAQSEIKSFHETIIRAEKLRKWSADFKDRTAKSRNACDHNDNFGCYCYDFSFFIPTLYGPSELKFKIWEHFYYAYYSGSEDSLTSGLSYLSRNSKSIKNPPQAYILDILFSHIEKIKSKFGNVVVLWGKNTRGIIDSHFARLYSKLNEVSIESYSLDTIRNISDNANIIVVDLFLTNKDLKDFAKQVFSIVADKTPCLTFLSLNKEHDSEEVKNLIEEEKKKLAEEERKKLKAQQEAEKKRKAEEARIKREQEERERKRKEQEELAKLLKVLPSKLKSCVSSWYHTSHGLPFNFLVDYYPTNRYEGVSEDVWDDRWTVWNFKNTPGKTSDEDHEEVLDDVIPRIVDILEDTFGNLLQYLTLVCVPASSTITNEARYDEFSDLLCKQTGMDNAFDEITILEDATPKHLGGNGHPTLSFNEDFFEGRCVMLFDDVITSGRSLMRMKSKLENMGANVICAFTIGKTM